MNYPPYYSNKGSILFIVLLFISFITVIVLVYNLKFDSEIMFIENENHKLHAYINCFSGTQFAINRFLTSSMKNTTELKGAFNEIFNPRLFLDGSQIKLKLSDLVHKKFKNKIPGEILRQLNNAEISISLQDSAGLINFLRLRRSLLKNFLLLFEIEDNQAEIIIDSIYDWVDPDDFPRLMGAEKEFYLNYTDNVPPNRIIYSINELQLIRGIDPGIFDEIKDYIDFSVDNRGLNPNTMPGFLFKIFGSLNEADIEKIINMRRQEEFKNFSLLINRTTPHLSPYLDSFQFLASNTIYIKVTSKMGNSKFFYIRFKMNKVKKEKNKKIRFLKISRKSLSEKYLRDIYSTDSWVEGIEEQRISKVQYEYERE